MVEGGYGYPSIYSPVMAWSSKMFRVGYTLREIISQLDWVIKYTDGLDINECTKHIQNSWKEEYMYPFYLNERLESSWYEGWTPEKWDVYHRHMKLQNLGV